MSIIFSQQFYNKCYKSNFQCQIQIFFLLPLFLFFLSSTFSTSLLPLLFLRTLSVSLFQLLCFFFSFLFSSPLFFVGYVAFVGWSVVAYCRRWWWWAFCRWWRWWVVGMGLMIHGFGGSALLRWQWSNPVLFLVAGCLIRWVFIWIL